MYHLGRQLKHTYWPYIVSALLVAALLTTSGVWVSRQLRANTTLQQSGAVVQHITASESAVRHIVTAHFSLDIPPHWEKMTVSDSPAPAGSWKGDSGEDAARRLDVYVGAVPAALAVNHLLPVAANDGRLDITGTVSDNCVNFTDKTARAIATGIASAKWDGVNFICDMGNYERDVVAIGSEQGINTVTLIGASAGRQQVLLVYTDNNANPDYNIFNTIVRSFRLL